MYAKCNALAKAQIVLNELPVRIAISWNALISAYVQQNNAKKALDCYERMRSEGTLKNGLFVLDRYEKKIQACIAETKTQAMQDADLWHARFGHVGYGSLMTLQRHNMVHDLSLLEMPPRHVCEGCVLGKMHRFVFSQDGSVRATRKLQLVHSDVCGPMRTPSVENSLYFVTFIDDFSRFCWMYPLKAKSDVFAIFQHYVSMVENETGCKVRTLRTDRGGEYMSGVFKDFLERKALNTNALCHTQHNRMVLQKGRTVKCIFVGYNSGSKGYRLYNPATNKIFESRDVIFAKTTAQPMIAFNVPHMQTQDVFEGFLPSFVENQESQQVDNFDQSFDQHVTPHDVEEIVREEQEVLREERTLPKWVQKTLQDSKLDAPLPRKTRSDKVLAFIQQFDAAFGDEGFTESSKLRHVAMHFQKSARQWWASLRANGEAPRRTWKNIRASIMKQFLSSNAKDKVLTEWQTLKLTPFESIHKYVNKFWDLHLKAIVYKKIDFEEQKQQFCTGLPENMNEYVNSQRPKTISAVIHHTIVAARINFQQGAKRNLKPMETKEKHEHKGKNQPQNSSKGNSSNNKAKEKGVYKRKNRLTPKELECYRKDN
ncbi:hypothetical protein L7F22_022520 [Adiantum nelumboides]|nr:hypothetical protein [Adiantum nelumboides]